MTGRPILPLPAEVAAQIKSSTAIVSLHGVVLDLLKNSLDAGPTKIDATVDFVRGACTVEDDGLGIAPPEFRDGGGLGKLYYTSKHDAHEALLGRNGTFLASLSAVSLLSITSRHHQHRSHNTLTVHHANAVERQLPASANHEIHGTHGTRVSVRNLFGNLPVRVKQRSKVLEHKSEHDRLWEALKASVAGLLLSWAGPVAVRVRDGENRGVFSFNTSDPKQTARGGRAHLASMLNILTQATYISAHQWPAWVPASASTTAISIKGAISLDPAPTKNVQFISLGVRPLSAELEHNELYEEVNRLFALSSFGTIEEDAEIDDLEKVRRRVDKRFKSDGYTTRQLKARKGVERHPMFHLRISLLGDLEPSMHQDRFIDDATTVQTIVNVLGAMVTQWLMAHHFRPLRHGRPRDPLKHSPTPHQSSSEIASMSPHGLHLSRPERVSKADELGSPRVAARIERRLSVAPSVPPLEQTRHRAFAEWTRIKSAKARFYNDVPQLTKFGLNYSSGPHQSNHVHHEATPHHSQPTTPADFMSHPVARGALNPQTPQRLASDESQPAITDNDNEDATIFWTDPLTKKTHLLNARTGCVMPHTLSRPTTEPVLSLSGTVDKVPAKSLRLPPKTTASEQTPWLDGVLKSWANPVFATGEKRIQKVSLEEDAVDQNAQRHTSHRCGRFDRNKDLDASSSTSSSRLSRDHLLGAEVIAQVDRKFILVKAWSSSASSLAQKTSNTMLVLIDQHAADERIRVEALFQELCAPVSPNSACSGYRSKLGYSARVASTLLDKPVQFMVSQQERIHFTTHAQSFARWGILYDALASLTPEIAAKDQDTLSVTALPPSISERCKSDAGLLISFLRSTMWKYASDSHRVPSASFAEDETPNWVQRLASCPDGLVEMVNSRACRSAIMFNDELNLEECKHLVQKLAACVFPFMCAHGRPSMIPLVLTERSGDSPNNSEPDRCEKTAHFVQAWKQWKR